MKIDEQKAYDKLSNDYDDSIECNRKLRVELNLSTQEVHRCHEASIKDFALIASLKNCSWYAVGFSFAISLVFGVMFMRYLVPTADWNGIIGVIIGIWWFSLFGYYGFWRAQFWS